MSGHSKWSTIKRQKSVTDARRSVVFTKYARLISVAARLGGADPASNFRLRLAIDKAKAANLPNENIERAIRAGSGEGKEGQSKEMLYEGFGPGGVAILVQAITDNPNRTAAEVRSLLTKHGGSMGSHNSVGWMFTSKGVIRLPSAISEELELGVIDAGAEDVRQEDGASIIMSSVDALESVKNWLADRGLASSEAEVELLPTTMVAVEEDVRLKLNDLLGALDELDDVTNIFTNEA